MKFSLNDLEGVLVVQLPRQLTYEHLVQAANYLAALDESLPVTPHRLTDASAVEDVLVQFAEMEAFSNRRQVAKLKNPIKSAIVAPKPLHMGFARMFKTLNNNPQMTIKIFPNAGTAWEWLRDPDATGPTTTLPQ